MENLMAKQRIDKVVDRPIFVVGTGRSGSTIFHRVFSEHPDLAWQSPLCDLFPDRPEVNGALLRLADLPVLGKFLKRYLRPGERYKYWDYLCPGFSQPCRDLLASDVTAAVARKAPRAVARLATAGKSRVLVKITGWPRVGYLRELFPDAKFIHVYRDGRAVANSLLEVGFWRGWQGPDGWRAGEMGPAQRAEWELHAKSFVALAGIQWKLLMAAMDRAASLVPQADFLHVRYEDFVANPLACFRHVAEFCDLAWSTQFEEAISSHHVRTANDKWRADLTPEQQSILESVLSESLQRYGYQTRPEYRAKA
ncbi:MAG TPA: sulfotransferase [Rhodanobacteraceae bacterium]